MNEPRVTTRVIISAEPLDVAALGASVGSPESGASVVFAGTARNHSPGREGVTHLEYEAYPEHVEAKIAEIVDDARTRWLLHHVAVAHRTGRVEIGEPSVVVAVSAAHRQEAFAGCRFIIDELKARAPIWKKETWSAGSEWVEGA